MINYRISLHLIIYMNTIVETSFLVLVQGTLMISKAYNNFIAKENIYFIVCRYARKYHILLVCVGCGELKIFLPSNSFYCSCHLCFF